MSHEAYLSPPLLDALLKDAREVPGVAGLTEIGERGGLETPGALRFLCALFEETQARLDQVLRQREIDRRFIDQRTRACFELNRALGIAHADPAYQTVIGQKDSRGRIVVGPLNDRYCRAGGGAEVAPIPEFLRGEHVTLFGPPDDAKLSINAMNSFHRKLQGEPPIVERLLAAQGAGPKWGADDEDSKTPIRADLISAGVNLTGCLEGTLRWTDPRSGDERVLADDHRALPIKRFPGLALPCPFLFYRGRPIPLHLYDFALHLFRNWKNEKALAFYVPKLENEEEAAYVRHFVELAELKIRSAHPEYRVGSIRLLVVLENPRAIFRVNEIMDTLHPYFAGASLGWHDYLASTARLFKEDSNYRIPVKADPEIVIKYIKASHDLLAEVVGSRGGIQIGGMYGILPTSADLRDPSFQVALKGFFKDVLIQLRRGLSGFWVAHPDFVRIGMAVVEAWKLSRAGDPAPLRELISSFLEEKSAAEIFRFMEAPDVVGLKRQDPLYPRALIVSDLQGSSVRANHDPEEVRYNVSQSLHYLTDWLAGNGCVALPTQVEGVTVRVMDDLATAERSRWEVWHEIHHGRFDVAEFVRIAHEELHRIRKGTLAPEQRKWLPVAMRIMLQLMTSRTPVEFATELLLPLTVSDPRAIDARKYKLDPRVERLHEAFSACGSPRFAQAMASLPTPDLRVAREIIESFTREEIIEAASFHGNIGEAKATLDAVASQEQALVLESGKAVQEELLRKGADYLVKFGIKYLVSAQGRSPSELLGDLEIRLGNTLETELSHARQALWEITRKRLASEASGKLGSLLEAARVRHGVVGASIYVTSVDGMQGPICLGESVRGAAGASGGTSVTENTCFEIASLSKSVATCFALEHFAETGIPLSASVNALLEQAGSDYRLRSNDPTHSEWANEVTLEHLLKHSALNMHYVTGVPASDEVPEVRARLSEVRVLHKPGTRFQYSGGGFLVLEHLLECRGGKPVRELAAPFLERLGLETLTFDPRGKPGFELAHGYLAGGVEVTGSRKMFPAFAAGAVSNAKDVSRFLAQLTQAYLGRAAGAKTLSAREAEISRATAVRMLQCRDRSSQSFMGVNIGLGIFTAEAGPNRLAIHQGANDGFRALFIHCYEGPDAGKGFTILCNADTAGVGFVAEAAQAILRELDLQGVDPTLFQGNFDASGVRPEEVVNQGYKDLIFRAFVPDLPEKITGERARDRLADYNLTVGAEIVEVSNQGFARAENLFSPFVPVFDPELYGRQGKVMDSWETVRHNARGRDDLVFRIARPSRVRFVTLSTAYHSGNHAAYASLEGFQEQTQEWETILPKISLKGHALLHVRVDGVDTKYSAFRVSQYPDGGLTRLAIFDESLPASERARFKLLSEAVSVPLSFAIPHAEKPLTPAFETTPEEVAARWKALVPGTEVDVACRAYGGNIVRASNEHYGPATQLISPFPPLHMFDGFESARSRDAGHFEEVVIGLGGPREGSRITRLEFDFTYFRNNNPEAVSVHGLARGQWLPLLDRTQVKAYAGNIVDFGVSSSERFEQIKIAVYPDGGMHRVRAYSVVGR